MTDIESARAARAARALALEELTDGTLKPVDVLRSPPRALLSTDIYDILLACKFLGREGVRQVLTYAAVWPHIALGDLSRDQRLRIIDNLPPRVR